MVFSDSGIGFRDCISRQPVLASGLLCRDCSSYFYWFTFCSVDNIWTSSSVCFPGWKQQLWDTLSQWANAGWYMKPVHYSTPFKIGCILFFFNLNFWNKAYFVGNSDISLSLLRAADQDRILNVWSVVGHQFIWPKIPIKPNKNNKTKYKYKKPQLYQCVHNPDILNKFFYFMHSRSLRQKYLTELMEGGKTRTLLCRPIFCRKDFAAKCCTTKTNKTTGKSCSAFCLFVVFWYRLNIVNECGN